MSFLYGVRYKKDICRPEVWRTPSPVQQRDLNGWGERAKTKVREWETLGGDWRKSREIERTGTADSRAFDDVDVEHGGGDGGMAEEILDGADIGAALEEAGCEEVTMQSHVFLIT